MITETPSPVSVVGTAKLPCTDPVGADQRAYADALARVTTAALTDRTVLLSGPGVELRFPFGGSR